MLRPRSLDVMMSLFSVRNSHSLCSKLARMTLSFNLKQNQRCSAVSAVETRRSISIFEPRRVHCCCTKCRKTNLLNVASINQKSGQLCCKLSNHFQIGSHLMSTTTTKLSGFHHTISLSQRCLHTSVSLRGLEEFFEDKKNLGEDKVGSGREWKVEELRLKDNVTLHKLWYVLLKEQNMLMTMEEEAERREVLMPSPERLDKVHESMQNIKTVIKERDEAVIELKTGRKELHPGRWEKTIFGYMRYVRPKEHFVPAYMNKYYATKRRKYGNYMLKYMSLWMEKELKRRKKSAGREKRKIKQLRKAFPDSDYWKNDS